MDGFDAPFGVPVAKLEQDDVRGREALHRRQHAAVGGPNEDVAAPQDLSWIQQTLACCLLGESRGVGLQQPVRAVA